MTYSDKSLVRSASPSEASCLFLLQTFPSNWVNDQAKGKLSNIYYTREVVLSCGEFEEIEHDSGIYRSVSFQKGHLGQFF